MNMHLNNSSEGYKNSFDDPPKLISNPVQESLTVDFPATSELYNAVFENSFHPSYIGNGNGNIFRFNDKLCLAFGYTRLEMIHLESSVLFDVNTESFINFLVERNSKKIAKSEVTGIRKSGEKFPCRISSIIYQSDNGEKRSMNTIVDISRNPVVRWNLTH